MVKKFKFFSNKSYQTFSPYCSYRNAESIIVNLISTNEWETTIFPKEYPYEHGVWRVLYINHRENCYHSVICHVPSNPGFIIERFLINIDL